MSKKLQFTGSLKGTDGKSAYAYAVESGYTGTEAEFAAKLAAEKFANPYALTFTGAATGSYDGSEALTVNIPSGGGSETWEVIADHTLSEDTISAEYDNLALKKVIIDIFAVGSESNSAAFNGLVIINDKTIFYTNALVNTVNVKRYAQVIAECVNGTIYFQVSTNNNNTYQTTSHGMGWLDGIEKIEKIKFKSNTSANVIGAGTRFRILGVENNDSV